MLEQEVRTTPADVSAPAWLDRSLLGGLAINWELVAFAALWLTAIALRWAFLDNKPFHHDESQHAYFSYQLFRGNGYKYDPLLHGPFQFEFTALMFLLFGPTEFVARLGDTLFGIGLVCLPFFMRRQLGKTGALILTAALALSPTFVYFSRWEREDSFVTFFTLLLVVLFFQFLDRPTTPLIVALGATWALAFSVKENTYISAFIFGTFVLGLLAYELLRLPPEERQLVHAIRTVRVDGFLYALAAFLLIFTVLFTTFFTNPHGLIDGFTKSVEYWLAQQPVHRGDEPWFYYLELLPAYEPLAVVFGLAGFILALTTMRGRFTLFLAWYALLSIIIYSWAGERMPWLLMQMALPLLMLAAVSLSRLWHARASALRVFGLAVAGFLALYMIHAMTSLTFTNPANPVEMLVYVQTSWDVETAVTEINGLQHRYANAGNGTLRVDIDSYDGSDWPWAWYFRAAKGVQYPNMSAASYVPQAPVIVVTAADNARLAPLLSGYTSRRYKMRVWWIPTPRIPLNFQMWWKWLVWREPWSPLGSWDVYLYVKKDVWNAAGPIAALGGPVPVANLPRVAIPPATAVVPTQVIGSRGTAPGDLLNPHQMAFDPAGNLSVIDVDGNRLVKYGPNGAFLQQYGSKGSGNTQLRNPNGVAIDRAGRVFIADTWNHRIVELSAHLQFVRTWGGFGDTKGQLGNPLTFYGPRAIALDAQGNLYITDTGNKRIVKFDNHGKFIAQWGGAGTGPGQFEEPVGIVLDPQGNIYVADTWNRRVQKLSPTGAFLAQWPMPGWSAQAHTEPYLTIVGSMLYATDSANNRIVEINTATGQLTRVLALQSAPAFNFPTGIVAGPGGKLYVADSGNSRIVVVTPPAP